MEPLNTSIPGQDNMQNQGHLTIADCRRNSRACRESYLAARKHAERHSTQGHNEARDWWINYAATVNAGVVFWEGQIKRLRARAEDAYEVPA